MVTSFERRRPVVERVGWSMLALAVLIMLYWLFLLFSAKSTASEPNPSSPGTLLREKRKNKFSAYQYFPDTIPRYDVRRDVRTGQVVNRGDVHKKLSLVPGTFDFGEAHYQHKKVFKTDELLEIHKRRVSFAEMQAAYQCAPTEPDFDTSSGAVSLLRMAPPTMKTGSPACSLFIQLFPFSYLTLIILTFS